MDRGRKRKLENSGGAARRAAELLALPQFSLSRDATNAVKLKRSLYITTDFILLHFNHF